jgi:cell division protein FtsN
LSSKGGERKVVITSPAAAEVSKSTMAVAPEAVKKPVKAVAEGKRFLVQVGTFGVKSNAEGAAGKLKGKGLPVARGKARGGALTVVYAGPFASSREAKAALSAARSLGFSDAVIVQ